MGPQVGSVGRHRMQPPRLRPNRRRQLAEASQTNSKEVRVAGIEVRPIGITNPPIDLLLEKSDSKYSLVLFSAKRARQINSYYAQLDEGVLDNVGPLVDTRVQEKPLSTALREIAEDKVVSEPIAPGSE